MHNSHTHGAGRDTHALGEELCGCERLVTRLRRRDARGRGSDAWLCCRLRVAREHSVSDTGSGGALALVIVLAAVTVAMVIVAVSLLVVAQARASATADSAALAAATAVAGYSEVAPCTAAADVAAANGARLIVCEVHGTAVTVGCETNAGAVWVPAISRAGQPEASTTNFDAKPPRVV